MERHASGDAEAFATVYDAVAEKVWAFARRKLRDDEAAADVVQETLLRMHRARGDFAPGSEVLPWAFTIARHVLIDRVRRERRERELLQRAEGTLAPAGVPLPDAQLVADQVGTALRARMAGLSAPQRDAFLLVRRDGMSLAQAASALSTTVSAVKLRMHRAAERLRAGLRDGRVAR